MNCAANVGATSGYRSARRCVGRAEARHRLPNDAGRADGFDNFAAGPSSMRGYTLIEVIVAFAVLALALTLLLGTLSGAARLVRQADDGGRAALYAQSLLDQAGVGSALQPGRQQGEFEDGRFRWTLQVAPYVDPGAPMLASPGNTGAQLFELVLEIDWGTGAAQRLQLRSLRLSQPDTVPSAVLP